MVRMAHPTIHSLYSVNDIRNTYSNHIKRLICLQSRPGGIGLETFTVFMFEFIHALG